MIEAVELLARHEARLVKVSPYALPHDYAPPVALPGELRWVK